MTAKEKAKELVYKYFNLTDHMQFDEAKECALIAINEIQNLPNMNYSNNKDLSQYDYWQKVKKEIEKL